MKIGFLAMSGIRAQDPELLRLGLTLPGFVERSKTIASLPSLGLLYLAAVTPAGHELQYFEAEADGREPTELYECNLVAISTFSAQVFEAYAIADRLRAAGVLVAMGGLHVSVRPEEAARHADYIIVGEGENVWPVIVRQAAENLANAVRSSPSTQRTSLRFDAKDFPPVDVTQLPVPRYDLLQDRPYNRITVQTSRGCPWRCDFCASTVMLQRPYRKRSIDGIVRDIQAIQRMHPGAFIEFADDNTFVDKEWSKSLCRALALLRVKWFTETDISVADDAELLSLMKSAGCRQVLIGLESPTASALDGVELRRNVKAQWATNYVDRLRRIQSAGITVNGCFILGLDGHTPDIFQNVRDFANAVPLFDVQITILTPFPGTPLYDRLLADNRLIHPDRWDLCTLFDVNFHPTHMTPEQLREGIRWLTIELYNETNMRQRRQAFLRGYSEEKQSTRMNR